MTFAYDDICHLRGKCSIQIPGHPPYDAALLPHTPPPPPHDASCSNRIRGEKNRICCLSAFYRIDTLTIILHAYVGRHTIPSSKEKVSELPPSDRSLLPQQAKRMVFFFFFPNVSLLLRPQLWISSQVINILPFLLV